MHCLFFCFFFSLFVGDLYGAIGSPVRLSRTVVVGRRQDLVQRLLYVLTYFIRCSELLETHLLDSAEDEAIVMPGSLITTSLRKGEVEESDYVLVTVHKPSGDYLSQEAHCQQTEAEDGSYRSDNSLQSSTYTDMEVERSSSEPPKEDDEEEDDEEDSNVSQGSMSSVLQSKPSEDIISLIRTAEVAEPRELQRELTGPLVSEVPVDTVVRLGSASPKNRGSVLEAETNDDLKLVDSSLPTELASSLSISAVTVDCKNNETDTSVGIQTSKMQVLLPSGIGYEKKPHEMNSAGAMPVPVLPGNTVTGPMALDADEGPATKVTFLIGDSMSPESDTESRRRRMEMEIKKHKQFYLQREAHSNASNTGAAEYQTNLTKPTPALQRVSSKISGWSTKCAGFGNEYFSTENPSEMRTIHNQETTMDSMHKHLLNPSGIPRLHELGDPSFQGAPSSLGFDTSLGSSRQRYTSSNAQSRCRCSSTDSSEACCCRRFPAEHDTDPRLCAPLCQDGNDSSKDQKCQAVSVNDWEIPRNESSDSALGDSESEETEDWQEEVLVPFPG